MLYRILDRLQGIQRDRPSRIGRRLFAFNLLVVFVPVAGTLYLDVYESRLLETQERGMVQQARLLAAAAGVTGIERARVSELLRGIEDRGDARIRVYDQAGALIEDSARLGPHEAPRVPDAYSQVTDPRRRVLYQVGAGLVRMRDAAVRAVRTALGRTRIAPTPGANASGVPPEVRTALAGRYGASARPTPGQRSLTLSSAVAVQRDGQVIGAVVVSQSTFRILQALYDVRLRLFEIVLVSLVAAAVLTWLAAATIVNPIVRLRQAALALSSRRSELGGFFSRVERNDEIGDLARSLEELAGRLDAHIQSADRFAADVAHEVRNPLAAIRTAAETIAASDLPQERERFLGMLLRDIDRLQGLVSGVREMAHIDAQLSSERRENVDVARLLLDRSRNRGGQPPVSIHVDATEPLWVHASADRLGQLFDNLIDNAASFSPDGEPIDIRAALNGASVRVTVADRGPGIPESHRERIFERFFSYRPGSDRRAHMGLGLAIARAVAEAHGGSIVAKGRSGGGTEFEVRLPSAADR